jgi:type IV pilus assembly protein PilY1
VTCCKTFIIVFTDGEPTRDFTSHANLQDLAHTSHGVHCTGSNTAVPPSPLTTCSTGTDGAGAGLTGTMIMSQHKTDYSSATHHLDDVAYWGHTNDLRQATVPVINEPGHDLAGFQNVTVYSFFAFGNIIGREILMQAARQGGFEDSNGNNQPDLQSEYDRVNNDTGLLVPDGIPDTYFESQNVDDLREKLLSAITSILQRAASGTSVSVLATSSTGEGAIYQAFFFPTTFVTIGGNTNQVLWTGFAQGLFIDKFGNLREDYSSATTIPSTSCTGAPDGKLVLTHDCIIKIRLDTDTTSPTFGQVLIDRFADDGLTGGCASVLPTPTCTAGDGVADTTTPLLTVTLTTGGVSNAQPMWEAGRQLALLDSGSSCESSSIWPIAGNMTQSGRTCRRIITWADLSNGGGVGGGAGTETLEVSTANVAALCPYLGAATVLHCNSTNTAAINAAAITADPSLAGCTGLTRQTCARNEATNIINFTRGFNVSGYRDRTFNVIDTGGSQVQKVWKLSDIIHSTPIVVGAPKERFDVIYGDVTYASYFQRYKDRRQVAYVGANDGMLHAFNAGFFRAEDSKIDGTGPNVQVRFTTTPKQAGSSTNCAALPCDAAVTTYSFRSDAPPLGSELWGFIPQDLLPQLRWMTGANYDHIYYVDLKPKVTDVRTFTADADHPGGWGTVLIGGFRLGGSCTNCAGSKGTARVVNSDFNGDGDTTDSTSGSTAGSDYRVFLSSYFVLDITNPEKEPTLLWTFRDQNLGLTTAAPAVLRVNPSADAKTSSTNEKWYVVFGSGPTHHDAFSQQTAQLYIVDLKAGPSYTNINKTNGSGCTTAAPCITVNTAASSGAVRAFSTGATGSFMGDVVTLDSNLDYRVDTVYAGYTLCNGSTTSTGCGGSGPMWKGAMWRLTTNGGNTDPDTWGASTGCGTTVCPTKLLSTFAYTTTQATTCTSASPCNVGPVTSSAALTSDDSNNIWVLFGTGRFFSSTDKSNVDIQHYFGVKDSFITSGSPAQTTERNNLFNSSNIIVCSNCSAGGNVSTTGSTTSFTTSFDQGSSSLLAQVLNTDGWFTTFSNPPNPLTPGERNLTASGPLVGGTLFFTTFTPVADICTASGTGLLYAVFYQTGGPYKESALGTTASGSNLLVNKSVSLGQGMPSQAAIQIGAQGTGTSGASSSAGCAGRTTVYIQSSTGVLGQNCGKTALSSWSRMVSWRDL